MVEESNEIIELKMILEEKNARISDLVAEVLSLKNLLDKDNGPDKATKRKTKKHSVSVIEIE